MKANISAKDFKAPLLKTLHTLSEGKHGIPIGCDKTYDPVCTLMKITPDQYGTNDSSGKPMTVQWIQWAFKELSKEGFAVGLAKGQWALTVAGVQKAETFLEPLTVPLQDKEDIQIVTPSADVTTDGYHQDPYIRGLAMKATPCLAYRADQSPVCKTCLLGASCQNAQYTELSVLARALAEEDAKALAALNAPPTPKPEAPKTTGAKNIPGGQAKFIQCLQTTVCNHCGKVVQKGEDAWWTRSLGGSDPNQSGSSGIYHAACYNGTK